MYVQCPRCSQQNYASATSCAYCGTPLPSAAQPGFVQTNAPGFAAGATGGGGQQAAAGSSMSQPQVGQLIDRKYKIERVLGEGGMGVVYLAFDVNVEQYVVIKSIRPEFANRGDFRDRTLSEGRAMAKIDHPYVVRFYSVINHPETSELYIVMQYIEGESLDRTLEKANAANKHLPMDHILRVFKMALEGVAAAHNENLIHRDLKPANIIVRAKDKVAKVMDFGISKAEGATKGPTQAGGIVGSLYYMAPEQIRGARDLDKRLDIYALGIVLYELVTGVVPFDGETEYDIMNKHMTQAVPSVLSRRPDAPAWIDDIITKATQKDRERRFQTCEEMRAAIDRCDGGLSLPRSWTEEQRVPQQGPEVVAHSPRQTGAGGTAEMPVPGPFPIPTHNNSSPTGNKRPVNGGLVAGLVALVLIGGGTGIYFATRPPPNHGKGVSGSPQSPEHSGADESTTDEEDPGPSGKKAPPAKDDAKAATVEDPLLALVGDWQSEPPNNRRLRAVRSEGGQEVEFKVVDGNEWQNSYATGETRFVIEAKDGTLLVTDYTRPTLLPNVTLSPRALGSCRLTPHEAFGKPLTAHWHGKDTLELTITSAKFDLAMESPNKVGFCPDGKVDRVTETKILRVKK